LKTKQQERTPWGEKANQSKEEKWNLQLYIAGHSSKSIAAINNLSLICNLHLKGRYRIRVIDLLKKPKLACINQILAIPTLVRQTPAPLKKIIGDLSNPELLLFGLGLKDVYS